MKSRILKEYNIDYGEEENDASEDLWCCRCWCCSRSRNRSLSSSYYQNDDTGDEIINETMIDDDLSESGDELDDDNENNNNQKVEILDQYGFPIDPNDAEARIQLENHSDSDIKKRKSIKNVRIQNSPSDSVRHYRSCSLIKKLRLYKWRYSSFINSPRVCFIYDTFFYTIFLLLFSYMILCKFVYYVDELNDDEETKSHLLAGSNNSNQSSEIITNMNISVEPAMRNQRQVTMPSRLEYTLMIWVFIYLIEEVKQVIHFYLRLF